MTKEKSPRKNPYQKRFWQPGDLVRIKKSVLQADEDDGIGIVIKNSSVQLAYEQGYCDEWAVLLDGRVVVLSSQSIWPMSPEDDYLKYVNTDFISY